MKKSILLFVQVALIVFSSAESYPQWLNKSGKFGGYIYSIIEKDGSIYAGTSDYGLYVSRDNGINWEADNGIPYTLVHDLLEYNDDIYAAAFGGLFRSTDNGSSWIQADSGIVNKLIFSLASNDKYLFAGTADNIYRSEDAGQTWVAIDSGITTDMEKIISLSQAQKLSGDCSENKEAATPPAVSIVVNGSNLYSIMGTDVYFSGNNGDVWEKIILDEPFVVSNIAIHDTLLLAGTYTGVYSLSKKDNVWQPTPMGLDYNILDIQSNDSVILACSYYDVFISRDRGATWDDINCGLLHSGWKSIDIAKDKFYTGTENGMIFRYTLEEDCWSAINVSFIGTPVTLIASNETTLFAGTHDGLFASSNNGEDWYEITKGLPGNIIGTLGVHGNYLFASASNGHGHPEHFLYRSSDNGITWSPADSGVDDRLSSIHLFYATESHIFIAAQQDLYRSSDDGESWVKIAEEIQNTFVRSLALSVNDKGEEVLYAGTFDWSYISVNNGDDWVRIDSSLYSVNVTAFGTLGADVFAGNGSPADSIEIFVSQDYGNTWQRYSNGITGFMITDFAFSGNKIFASTLGSDCGNDGGIFLSRYHRDGWDDVTTGLESKDVFDLHIFGNNIFAGTSRGLWMRPLSEMTVNVTEETNTIPSEFKLEQNYPNPFNPITNLEYHVPPDAGIVTLKVYDILGNEISILVNEVKNAGTYKVTFDGSNLSSGIYFYTLQSGSFKQTKKFVLMK